MPRSTRSGTNPKACEDYINDRYIKLKAEYEEAMAK